MLDQDKKVISWTRNKKKKVLSLKTICTRYAMSLMLHILKKNLCGSMIAVTEYLKEANVNYCE